jgi:hypothetical protein
MVKGVTRQVVVVRCPDARYFEEATFLLREDILGTTESDRVLKDACRAADAYIREHTEKRKLTRRVRYLLLGGAAVICGVLAVLFL